jgi:hypothetical protein
MIVYNVTLLDEPSTQLLLALSVGYIVYWQTELIRKSEKHKASILANNSD